MILTAYSLNATNAFLVRSFYLNEICNHFQLPLKGQELFAIFREAMHSVMRGNVYVSLIEVSFKWLKLIQNK